METKSKKFNRLGLIATLALFVFATAVLLMEVKNWKRPGAQMYPGSAATAQKLWAFAGKHDLGPEDWPEELVMLMENNPDTEEFVLQYPLKKELPPTELKKIPDDTRVPMLFQWDTRWGYTQYGNGMLGLTGCGPTCLSMVCLYLLEDPMYDPAYVARFSVDNGYCVPGSGSAWTLISEGGVKLGLDVVEIPLDQDRLIRNLEAGYPVICVMGPGDFTSTGHFIVMTDYRQGKIQVNDPNSKVRSEMLWEYETIESQIQNLWVCRLP